MRQRGPRGCSAPRNSRVLDANQLNVGAESHLYGKGAHALWRERSFGLLEEEWPALRTEPTSTGHVNGRERQMVATFMARQVARNREHLLRTTVAAEPADFAHERPVTKESVRRFIQQQLRATTQKTSRLTRHGHSRTMRYRKAFPRAATGPLTSSSGHRAAMRVPARVAGLSRAQGSVRQED